MQVFFFFFFPNKMLTVKIPLLPCTPDRSGLNGASGLPCPPGQVLRTPLPCHWSASHWSASVPWEKEFLGFIGFNDCLCVGATPSCGRMCGHFKGHLATELWGSSFLEPIKKNSWCRLRNRGTEGWSNTPVSTQLDHDQVGNQNLRFLTPCSS